MQRWPILVILALAGVPALADTAAVLPFWNSTANARPNNLDWIGESIAETVRESVGSRGLPIIDRDEIKDAFHRLSLRQLAVLSQASVIKIGEELDAEQIVYGSFEFTPAAPATNAPVNGLAPGTRGSLRISARIIDLKRLHQGPEFAETGALEDLATLQAHLAWRALALLAPKLAPPESEFRSVRVAVRLDAQENYIRGLLTRNADQREKFFLQASRLDSRFADPCYRLGQIHYERKDYRQAAEWLEKVGAEDLHYREARFLLGLSLFQSADYAGAQKEFQTIAAAVPLMEVYNNLAASESRRNQPQAADDFRKAVEGDPSDPVYQFNLGYALWKKGEFSGAAEHFRAVLDHTPDDQMATLLLGRCLKKQGLQAHAAGNTSEARLTGLERLKTNYEERAYWQLKAMVEQKPK
ncbi:MAG TPA: tetratricopeptide repeat protein [Bryobacteraceae bacterium]|nr:tetratricopeptide repeat protein [Bryobacteraceae bacterium]